MAKLPWALLISKPAEVLDDGPDLSIGELVTEANHAGPCHAVFDSPEDFPFCTLAPESTIMEIAWRRFQLRGDWTIALPGVAMAVQAGTLALVQVLTLLNSVW